MIDNYEDIHQTHETINCRMTREVISKLSVTFKEFIMIDQQGNTECSKHLCLKHFKLSSMELLRWS